MRKLIEMELMLAGWRETHNGGFIVQLLVQPDDAEFFKGATAAKGKIAGQLYQTYWMPFTDDAEAKAVSAEKPTVLVPPPIEPTFPSDKDKLISPSNASAAVTSAPEKAADTAAPAAEKKKPHFPDGLCGLAVRWCADEHFLAWLPEAFPAEWLPDFVPDEEAAKQFILNLCAIDSRKELNKDYMAAEIFKTQILEPYSQVRQEDGVDEDFSDGKPF